MSNTVNQFYNNINDDIIDTLVTNNNPLPPPNATQPQSISQLINRLTNEHQIKALRNINHDNWSGERLYLVNYTKNESTARTSATLEGTFQVLGSLNAKRIRSIYEVKFFKEGQEAKGSFWCSCPDHKFNSKKKDMVCKHICFIVCRFGKVYDTEYFLTKQLRGDSYTAIRDKAQEGRFSYIPGYVMEMTTPYVAPETANRNQCFTTITREITAEDSCPICFDEMLPNLASMPAICCPECHNNIHKECMEVWLERNNTCVYCRSNVWHTYKK